MPRTPWCSASPILFKMSGIARNSNLNGFFLFVHFFTFHSPFCSYFNSTQLNIIQEESKRSIQFRSEIPKLSFEILPDANPSSELRTIVKLFNQLFEAAEEIILQAPEIREQLQEATIARNIKFYKSEASVLSPYSLLPHFLPDPELIILKFQKSF